MAQIILDSNNNLIQGDFDNATLNNRTKLQTTTTNATTNVYVVPNGSSTSAGVSVANNSSLTNASKIVMATNGTTDTQIISGVNGSGTYLPMSFYVNNALAMQIATTGVTAYGGGTVSSNTAFGTSALFANTTGAFNVAIGTSALAANNGDQNVAIGRLALSANTSGTLNVAIGEQALATNSTSSYNTAVGRGALLSQTTATSNTAIGYNAGFAQTSGLGLNVFAGFQAGANNATGNNCIYIGDRVSASSTSVGTEIVIGTNSQTGKGVNTAFISANTGPTYNGANSTTWATISDQRIKKNIADNTDGLNKILAIKVRNFEYRLPEEVDQALSSSDAVVKEGVQLGVIAQELQQVLPECVTEQSTGVLSVQTDNLVWYLINSVKEQQTIINELKSRIEALESK